MKVFMFAAATAVAVLSSSGVAAQAEAAGVPAGFETQMIDRKPGVTNVGGSTRPAMSRTGLLVAFASEAENLVDGGRDRNDASDIFVGNSDTGVITRVSIATGSDGVEGDSDSDLPSIDWTGANVVYTSYATNLIGAGRDTNGAGDIFLRNTPSNTTRRISQTSGGAQANGTSADPAISGNGRYVAFTSTAPDLVPNDTNGVNDIFVADLTTRAVSRVSVRTDGGQANGGSFHAAISGDGRYVAFASDATNLVSSDNNGFRDVFVRDRQTGTTTRVSVHSNGRQADGPSQDPSIAMRGDGYVVAFTSSAKNLVGNDNNGLSDVYVQTSQPRRTARASYSKEDVDGNGPSSFSAVSGADLTGAQYVAFTSSATNLVDPDDNRENDVFRYNIVTGETVRWSVATGGDEGGAGGNNGATQPAIDYAGHTIAYTSDWSDLDPPDTSNTQNIFLTVDHGGS